MVGRGAKEGRHTYSFLDDPNAALSGVSITQITGINDSNEIAGFYVGATSGLRRGFEATIATPEPGTVLLFSSGVVTLLFIRRSRRCKSHVGSNRASLGKSLSNVNV